MSNGAPLIGLFIAKAQRRKERKGRQEDRFVFLCGLCVLCAFALKVLANVPLTFKELAMLSRTADHLFCMARYMERAGQAAKRLATQSQHGDARQRVAGFSANRS